MLGIFSKLNDRVCAAELEQRTRELSVIIDDISKMKARELQQLGKRMARLELDIAKTYKAPPSDVFNCKGRCWTNHGSILGDLKATAKGMKPNLESPDQVAKERGRHMVLVCSLLTTAYRTAKLENETKSLVEPCREVRMYAVELAEALKSTGQEEVAAEKIERLMSDLVRRFATLPQI